MSRGDRLIGIVLGILVGVAVVIAFVFLGSADSIDAPSVDARTATTQEQTGTAPR